MSNPFKVGDLVQSKDYGLEMGGPRRVVGVLSEWVWIAPADKDDPMTYAYELWEPYQQRYEVGKTYEVRGLYTFNTVKFTAYEVDDDSAYGVTTYSDGSKSGTTRLHANFDDRVVREL